MGGWLTGGVAGYVGVTRCGKTTLAMKNLSAAIEASRQETKGAAQPVVTVDAEEAADFAGIPHARDVFEVLEVALSRRETPRVWTPEDDGAWDVFCDRVSVWGGVHVMLDGVHAVASKFSLRPSMRTVLKRHGHGRLGPVTWDCTTQAPSELHPDFRRAFTRKLYVFRTAVGIDADTLRSWYGLKGPTRTNQGRMAEITDLARGEYVEIDCGFPEASEAEAPDVPAGADSHAGAVAPKAGGRPSGEGPDPLRGGAGSPGRMV